jgi:hypothetical protein
MGHRIYLRRSIFKLDAFKKSKDKNCVDLNKNRAQGSIFTKLTSTNFFKRM